MVRLGPRMRTGCWATTTAALSNAQEAIELARSSEHPYNLAVALAYGAITHHMRDDLPALRDTVGELRELCDRYGFGYYREWGLILDGWSRADGSGVELAQAGDQEPAGGRAPSPACRTGLPLLADVQGLAGQPASARATLDAAWQTATPATTCGGSPR